MAFIAAIEVDHRQRLITSVDTLKEMLGGSWTVEDTIAESRKILDCKELVKPIKTVSGELWLQCEADDIADLEQVLWALRERFVRELQLPCSFSVIAESAQDSVNESQKKLMEEVRRVKNGKVDEIGFPALPWFAPCQIQPDLFATEWHPNAQHKRRALLNQASAARSDRGFKTLKHYLDRFPEFRFRHPEQFDDFRFGEENSWFAVIRLDADRNSEVFTAHPWRSWDELTKCSEAIERSLKSALDFAVRETLKTARIPTEAFPVSPMIAAGEDFLLVARRDLAVPLALHLVKKYDDLVNQDDSIKEITGDSSRLTLSGGILFTRMAYPFSQLNEIVTDLEHSAKEYRAKLAQSQQTGCIDLYWLDSSGRESPVEQRRKESRFLRGPTDIYQVFSAPWTDEQFQAVWDSAIALLDAGIARRKWHDIQRILRLGMPLSGFAWKMWQNGLGEEQRNNLRKALTSLRAVKLWPNNEDDEPWVRKDVADLDAQPYVTVLDDIHRILEMVRMPGGEE